MFSKKTIKNRGTSLIEILIYVAILGIIGTILTGYFIVAINSEAEHNRRNDLATSVQNITSTIRYDITQAIEVGAPLLNMSTSSSLEILLKDGISTFTVENTSFVKKFGTSTQVLTEKSVMVDSVSFMRREHYETRLNATSTSIEFHMVLKHKDVKGMTRSIDSVFMVGMGTL